MSLVKNLCKDMIEQHKKDKLNNVNFDGSVHPIITTMIPLKVCTYSMLNLSFSGRNYQSHAQIHHTYLIFMCNNLIQI